MIKVDCSPPSASAAKLLADRRRRGTLWASRRPGRTQGDADINDTLTEAFHGKCGYCECIEAETIDHFWPQDSNADKIWDWNNYIWSCDACQRRKSNRSPVSDAGYQMVDPREDEPLNYLRMDPLTGKIIAIPTGDAIEQRGAYTLWILELDQRPDLDRQRQLLYDDVYERLVQIVDPDSSQATIDRAWAYLQRKLDVRQPYLAIVQQLFTLPSYDEEPLVQRLFEIIADARVFLQRFKDRSSCKTKEQEWTSNQARPSGRSRMA